MEELTSEQLLLMEIRDKLCDRNAAQLAREIKKDPTYVNRLFYPVGKPGRKGIGLEIMAACTRAFYLPAGFWEMLPPALTDENVQVSKFMRDLRSKVVHGQATNEEQAIFAQYDTNVQSHFDRVVARMRRLEEQRERDLSRIKETEERLASYTGEPLVAREPRVTYGRLPIMAWDHPDDLPPGELVMIPKLEVNQLLGDGDQPVEVRLAHETAEPFRSDWIRPIQARPNRLAAMRVSGDSMAPTLHDGDSLLVDTSQTEVIDGKVYAIWYGGGERVRRLFRLPSGGLRIKSDNPAFDAFELGTDHAGQVRIIGRVVFRGGVGGL